MNTVWDYCYEHLISSKNLLGCVLYQCGFNKFFLFALLPFIKVSPTRMNTIKVGRIDFSILHGTERLELKNRKKITRDHEKKNRYRKLGLRGRP